MNRMDKYKLLQETPSIFQTSVLMSYQQVTKASAFAEWVAHYCQTSLNWAEAWFKKLGKMCA